MRGQWLLISGIVILAGIGAGALSLLRHRSTAPAAPTAARPQPAGSELILPAQIRARQVISVAAPVAGTLEAPIAEAGQHVSQGQLLGHIKNTGLESTHEQAAAELERAEARAGQLANELLAARLEASRARADASRAQTDFVRAETVYLRQQMLMKEGATPRLVYEKALSEYNTAKNERDTREEVARGAEERLATVVRTLDAARRAAAEKQQGIEESKQSAAAADIVSPADGLLLACSKQPGEEVAAGLPGLFQIAVNLSELEAVIEPEPGALARIGAGQEAAVLLADAPDPIFGRVREVDGGQAIIEFTSPNPAIRPGLTAQVRIRLQ